MKNNNLLHFSLFMAMLFVSVAVWGQTPQSLDISQGSITITSTSYKIGDDQEQNYTGDYVISGTTTSNTVTVSSGTHNITLNGVSIDVSGKRNACAFAIAANAQVNLTLAGENVLKSVSDRAALNVPANATLIIMKGSTGSLVANGGTCAAGIGGNSNGAAGTITIQGGHIKATAIASTGEPAAIGGGGYGDAGTISITGGYVSANGCGKGIGGGASKTGGSISISGGVVVANGIGTGGYRESTSTTITGGVVFSTRSINTANKSGWKGIIADNSKTAIIYPDNNNYTLAANDSIPEGYTLKIENGKTLTVGSGNTFTNKGTITVESGGTLQNDGTFINDGTFTNNGTLSGNKVALPLKLSASSGSTPYNGNALTFTYTYSGDGTVSATSSDGSVATASVSGNTVTVKPVGGGVATITVSAAEGSLYAAISETYTVTVKALLTKDNFTFIAPTDLVYTGKALTIGEIITTELATGAITKKYYKNGTGEGLTEITDAGAYTVKIDVVESDLYLSATGITDESAWTFNVDKATLTKDNFTFTQPTNLVYTGQALTISATVTTQLSVGTITEKYYKDGTGEGLLQITDAGTYTVKVDVAGSDNNNSATGITGDGESAWTFTVAQKKITVTPESDQILFKGWTGNEISYETDVEVALSGALSIEKNTADNTYKVMNPVTGGLTLNETDAKNYTLKFTADVPITVYEVEAKDVEATITSGANEHGWAKESLTLKAPTGFVFTDAAGSTSGTDTKDFTDEGNYYLKQTAGTEVYSHPLPIDKTAPLAPAAPDEGSLTTTTATFTLSDPLSGVASYTVSEAGTEIAAWLVTKATTAGELSLVYTFTGMPGSKHTLDFEVTDMAGNKATSSVEFTLKSNPYVPPVSSYYDIYLESSDSVRLSSGSRVVEEGYSFTVTAEVAEGYDPATLVVEYKRGRSGVWRTLEADSNGKYRVRSVYDDIYVRASVRRDGDPTAVESVPGGASRIWAVGSRIRIGAARPVSVRVVSLGGHLVRSEQLPAGDSEIQGLPQGVYIVLLSDGSRGKVMVY